MTEVRAQRMPWRCVADVGAGVGEVPTWDPLTGRLYWLDLYGPTLSAADAAGKFIGTWTLPDMPGSFGLRPDGQGAVVATASGVYDLAFGSGTLARLHEAPYDQSDYRFNDGRCDRQGRLWFGTNRKPRSLKPAGSASFWRLDRDGLSEQFSGITIANGIAFSPAGDTMYIADSPRDEIVVFDYDRSAGKVSGRRTFATVPGGSFPDGAAIDSEGGYWVALFNSARIARFLPSGKLDRVVESPVPQPTMICFGGPGLTTLYLTSARRFLSEAAAASAKLSGGIFACPIDVAGLAEPYVDAAI